MKALPAILVVGLLLSVSLLHAPTVEAMDWKRFIIVAENAAAGAIVGAKIGAIGGPVGVLIGAAAGAIIGGAFGAWLSDHDEDPSLYAYKQLYARLTAENQRDMVNFTKTEIHNADVDYKAMIFFFVRKAEYAAWDLYYQQYEGFKPMNYTYGYDEIIRRWGAADALTAQMVRAFLSTDNMLNKYSDTGRYFTGKFGDMSIRVAVGGAAVSTSGDARYAINNTFLLSYNRYYHFSPHHPVFIVYFGSPGTGLNFRLRAVNMHNEPVSLTAPDGTPVSDVTLQPGGFVRVLVPTGDAVKFVTDDLRVLTHTAILGFATVDPANLDAPMYPALLGLQKSEDGIRCNFVAYYYPNTNGGDITYASPGTGWSAAEDIYFEDIYDSSGASYRVSLSDILREEYEFSKVLQRQVSVIDTFARAYYEYLKESMLDPEKTPVLPPDAMFPDPEQLMALGSKPEEAKFYYAVFLNSLYRALGGASLDSDVPLNATLPAGTFRSIRIVGTVRAPDGDYVIGSESSYAVFVPYASIRNITLRKGTVKFDQPGFAIVLKEPWEGDVSTRNITDFTLRYVVLGMNYTLDIKRIEVGENLTPVNEVTLNVTSLNYWVPNLEKHPGPSGSGDKSGMLDWIRRHPLTFAFTVLGFLIALFTDRKGIAFLFFGAAILSYFVLEPAVWKFGVLQGVFR